MILLHDGTVASQMVLLHRWYCCRVVVVGEQQMVLLQLSTAAGEQFSTDAGRGVALHFDSCSCSLFLYYSLALALALALSYRPATRTLWRRITPFNVSFAALKRSTLSYSGPNSTSAVGPLSFHGRQIAISYKHI